MGVYMGNEFRKASEIVSKFFDGLKTDDFNRVNSFLSGWNTIVGDKIAAHSRVIDVDKGMLIIEVDHPGWSQQILFLKRKILFGLGSQFPDFKITNLTIRVVSECIEPYKRLDVPVGEGIPRVEDTEDTAVIDSSLDNPLKVALEKLKISIERGKK